MLYESSVNRLPDMTYLPSFFVPAAEREEEEEMSKAGMSVNRRPKPKKAPRPKSQPPGVSAPGVQSSPSHSSQEDLVKQRTYL